MNKFPDIATFLPHEGDMIGIDKLINVTAATVHCQVGIDTNGMFFDKEINGAPAWVGIEFMAQTVAAWSGYHLWLEGKSPSVFFLAGSRHYESACEVYKQGQILEIYAERLIEKNGASIFACSIESNGKIITTSRLSVVVPSHGKLDKMLKRKNND